MNTQTILSKLRYWLYIPTAQSWDNIVRLFDCIEDSAGLQVSIDLALEHLVQWPSSLRQAPWHWIERTLAGDAPPSLRLVKSLTIDSREKVSHGLFRLFRCPHLCALEHLALRQTAMGGQRVLKALAQASWTTSLRELHFDSVRLRDTHLDYLLSCSDQFPALQSLHLERNQFTARALQDMETVPMIQRLHELHIDGNPLGSTGGSLLGRIPFSHLKTLCVGGTKLGPTGLAHLVASPHLAQLERLDLTESNLCAEDLRALGADNSFVPQLRELNLNHNDLSARKLHELFQVTSLHKLQRLGLASCGLHDKGVGHLTQEGALPALEQLDVRYNQLRTHSGQLLGQATTLSQLQSILFAFDDLGDKGLQSLLGPESQLKNLQKLSLLKVAISPKGIAHLASSKVLSNLQELDLSCNEIGDKGAIALSYATNLRTLQALVLERCNITTPGIRALAHAGPRFPKLAALYLGLNDFCEEGIESMLQARFLRLGAVDIRGMKTQDETLHQNFSARYVQPPARAVEYKEDSVTFITYPEQDFHQIPWEQWARDSPNALSNR